MLPDGTIPGSLADLLVVFRFCFTAPTFTAFGALVVGSIAQTRRLPAQTRRARRAGH
jgi:hypothetical protein